VPVRESMQQQRATSQHIEEKERNDADFKLPVPRQSRIVKQYAEPREEPRNMTSSVYQATSG
jgi:hypothetical protein